MYIIDTFKTDSLKLFARLPYIPDVSPEIGSYFYSTTKYFPNQTYYHGDSICDSLEIQFSKNSIPFFYQKLVLQISDVLDSVQYGSENFKVYFTPYNTIELWNSDDFDGLKRIWDTPKWGFDSLRYYVHKDSLPISNMSDSDFFSDSIPVSYLSHPALPYLVPVNWIDDIYDEPSSNGISKRDDGCGASKKRWKGTISGKLTTQVISDLGGNVTIPISGIRVKIMEKDGGVNPDDLLGVTFTNDNGEFSMFIDECQRHSECLLSPCEGDDLEIYLIIESRNINESIKVRHRYGGTRSITINKSTVRYWNYNDGNISNLDLGELQPSKDIKPQLLHWGNICRNFVNGPDGLQSLGFSIGSKAHQLDIMIHPTDQGGGGVFIPATYKSAALIIVRDILGYFDLINGNRFSNDDAVYIGEESENDEDLFFHEFGHYLMWHLQGKSWQNPLEASFADHGDEFNAESPALAWNEGWATGFGQIVDLFFRHMDNEAGNYTSFHNVELRELFGDQMENISRKVNRGTALNPDIQIETTVTHGFVSEGNIASLIYDLFDGPNKQGRHFDFVFGTTESHNDGGNDNVTLTFAMIAKPLLNNQGTGLNSNLVIKDITNYAMELGEVVDCQQKRLLQPLFLFNGLRSFDNPVSHRISTDRIAFNMAIDHESFTWKGPRKVLGKYLPGRSSGEGFFKPTGIQTYGYMIDFETIDVSSKDFNLCVRSGETDAHISDPLTVTSDRFLFFNGNVSGDLVSQSGSNPPSASRLGGYVSSRLEVNDGATMELGSSDESTFADVHFCQGSMLILRKNNGAANNPKIIVNNNSTLIIDEGAIFQYFPNTTIILNGPNAVLEIRGQLQIMNGATFSVQGGNEGKGFVIFNKAANSNGNRLINSPTNDGNVELIGLGSTQKLIVIDGTEGLIIDDDIINFTIKQAKILMGQNSIFEPTVKMSGKVFFEQVNIAQLNSGQRHNGIRVNGVNNEFHMVRMDGGNFGFTNTSLLLYKGNHQFVHRGEKLYLRAVQITNCSIGIMSYSSGITYHGGFVKGYTIAGWKSIDTRVPSDVTGVWFNNDEDNSGVFGILADGVSSTSEITLTGCKFQSNESGIQAWNIPVRLKNCNYFENNDLGIQMEAWSKLDMSNNSYTKFDGNTTHFMSRFHGILHMYDGHNGFTQSGNTTIFFASLEPQAQSPSVNYATAPAAPSAANYNASSNFFEAVPVVSLTSGNCWIDERSPHPQARLLNLATTSTYPSNNPSIWMTAHTNQCTTPDYETLEFTGTGGGVGQFLVSKYTPLNTVQIPSGMEYGNNLLTVCSGLLDSLYIGFAPNYSSIVCQLNHLARYTYTNSSPLMSDLKLELLDHSLKAYALGVSTGNIFVSEDSLAYSTNCLLGGLDTLLIDANNDSLPWKYQKFNLTADKSVVLRLAQQNSDAAYLLNSALSTYTDSLQQVYLYKWICINEAEVAYKDSTVSLDSLYITFPCYGNEINFSAFTVRNSNIGSHNLYKSSIGEQLLVYPNPAQDILNVEINSDTQIKKIMIFDVKGVLQLTIQLDLDMSETSIDISELNSGAYIIQVITDCTVYTQQMLINK